MGKGERTEVAESIMQIAMQEVPGLVMAWDKRQMNSSDLRTDSSGKVYVLGAGKIVFWDCSSFDDGGKRSS